MAARWEAEHRRAASAPQGRLGTGRPATRAEIGVGRPAAWGETRTPEEGCGRQSAGELRRSEEVRADPSRECHPRAAAAKVVGVGAGGGAVGQEVRQVSVGAGHHRSWRRGGRDAIVTGEGERRREGRRR
jgi:hypothetical protein